MAWQLAASVVGVLAIAALVYWLGLGNAKLADSDQARRLAEDMISGFRASDVILSDDREAALLIGADKSTVLLKRHGAKFAARKIDGPVKYTRDQGDFLLESGERSFGAVRLSLAAEKAERLADKLLTAM